MALTHVQMWDDNIGFHDVTVEEACAVFPECKTVSAKLGYFMCKLCGDRVLLTEPGINRRHFRHEQGKTQDDICEERSININKSKITTYKEHPMPIRLFVDCSDYSMKLEIGFFTTSRNENGEFYCDFINIKSINANYKYDFNSRKRESGIAYLLASENPETEFQISYDHPSNSVSKYWPIKVDAVNPFGSIFEVQSGRLIRASGNAKVGIKYYLITKEEFLTSNSDIESRLLHKYENRKSGRWYLFSLKALRFSRESAKVFMKYGITLKKNQLDYCLLWPVAIREVDTSSKYESLFIYHHSENLFFLVNDGSAVFKIYPQENNSCQTIMSSLSCKIVQVKKGSKEMMISVGEKSALGFNYLINYDTEKCSAIPQVNITGKNGEIYIENEYLLSCHNNRVIIKAEYDGRVEIHQMNSLVCIYKYNCNEYLEIDIPRSGCKIIVFLANDAVRTVNFLMDNRKNQNAKIEDEKLYGKLCKCDGIQVPITHSFATAALQLSGFEKTNAWIRAKIKNGKISKKAILQIELMLKQEEKTND